MALKFDASTVVLVQVADVGTSRDRFARAFQKVRTEWYKQGLVVDFRGVFCLRVDGRLSVSLVMWGSMPELDLRLKELSTEFKTRVMFRACDSLSVEYFEATFEKGEVQDVKRYYSWWGDDVVGG